MDDQLYSKGPYEFLWKLLADPADNTSVYASSLQQLVDEYPQSGILQALFVRFGDNKSFKQASVHFNAKSLYKLINFPSGFTSVPPEKIILGAGIPTSIPVEKFVVNNGPFFTKTVEKVENSNPVFENPEPTEIPVFEMESLELQQVLSPNEEKNENTDFNEQVLQQYSLNYPLNNEDEIFNEEDQPIETSSVEIDPFSVEKAKNSQIFDLFSLEGANSLKEGIRNLKASRSAPAIKAPKPNEDKQKEVTKYHDDAMPYSFMWWLKKTRKEHADVYQPYVKPEPAFDSPVAKSDELQHQYVENIFHITSVADLEKNTAGKPVEYDTNKKENKIIERFIKEEPQIKPQQLDKLDNENKAKKSSEDRDEFVTETLAKIYTEQMLYPKAIIAYKKLILKFPEKSRYFADKIDQLEKKINL